MGLFSRNVSCSVCGKMVSKERDVTKRGNWGTFAYRCRKCGRHFCGNCLVKGVSGSILLPPSKLSENPIEDLALKMAFTIDFAAQSGKAQCPSCKNESVGCGCDIDFGASGIDKVAPPVTPVKKPKSQIAVSIEAKYKPALRQIRDALELSTTHNNAIATLAVFLLLGGLGGVVSIWIYWGTFYALAAVVVGFILIVCLVAGLFELESRYASRRFERIRAKENLSAQEVQNFRDLIEKQIKGDLKIGFFSKKVAGPT